MNALNASRFACLAVFALLAFSSQAVAQKKGHERTIEKREPVVRETPRPAEPRQQPQPQSQPRQQAPVRQEPAPQRPSAPTPRPAPVAAPAPAPHHRIQSAQANPQPQRAATQSAPATHARESFQESDSHARAIPPQDSRQEPQIPRARFEDARQSARENSGAVAAPARQENPAKEPATEVLNHSFSLPEPKTKRPLPTLRWKETSPPVIKPAPATPRVAPKVLSPYYGQRFLPQLPTPVVRAAGATGTVEKTHFAPKKKNWASCKPIFDVCRPCIWLPPVYWIPVTIFSFVEIPCVQPQVIEIQEEEVVLGQPLLLDLDAVEKAVRLGDLYFRAGKFDKAAASYMEAVALAPEQAELYFLLSDALFAIGDFHFASYCIRTALELDPTLARSEADKRDFYGNRDDFYRQLRILERYLQEYPEDADAQLVLAYNRRFAQDPTGAIRALRRTLEIQDDSAARTLLEAMTKR